MSKIRVVIDTNVLRTTINRKNFEFFIYEAFAKKEFDWIVSTEILEEYAEKLCEFYSESTADYVLDMLCNANNTIFAEPCYQWDLITADPDDNKFSNLALSLNAHCLLTFDKHFNIFKTLDFPKLTVLNPKQFKRFLEMYPKQ